MENEGWTWYGTDRNGGDSRHSRTYSSNAAEQIGELNDALIQLHRTMDNRHRENRHTREKILQMFLEQNDMLISCNMQIVVDLTENRNVLIKVFSENTELMKVCLGEYRASTIEMQEAIKTLRKEISEKQNRSSMSSSHDLPQRNVGLPVSQSNLITHDTQTRHNIISTPLGNVMATPPQQEDSLATSTPQGYFMTTPLQQGDSLATSAPQGYFMTTQLQQEDSLATSAPQGYFTTTPLQQGYFLATSTPQGNAIATPVQQGNPMATSTSRGTFNTVHTEQSNSYKNESTDDVQMTASEGFVQSADQDSTDVKEKYNQIAEINDATERNKDSTKDNKTRESIEDRENEERIEDRENEERIEDRENEESIENRENEESIEDRENEESIEDRENEESIQHRENEESTAVKTKRKKNSGIYKNLKFSDFFFWSMLLLLIAFLLISNVSYTNLMLVI